MWRFATARQARWQTGTWNRLFCRWIPPNPRSSTELGGFAPSFLKLSASPLFYVFAWCMRLTDLAGVFPRETNHAQLWLFRFHFANYRIWCTVHIHRNYRLPRTRVHPHTPTHRSAFQTRLHTNSTQHHRPSTTPHPQNHPLPPYLYRLLPGDFLPVIVWIVTEFYVVGHFAFLNNNNEN